MLRHLGANAALEYMAEGNSVADAMQVAWLVLHAACEEIGATAIELQDALQHVQDALADYAANHAEPGQSLHDAQHPGDEDDNEGNPEVEQDVEKAACMLQNALTLH